MPSKGQSVHRYTVEQRHEALRLSDDLGVAKAAAKLGIPGGTISSWRWSRTHSQGATATPTASKSVSATAEVIGKPGESATVTKTTRRVAKLYTPSQKAEALEMLSVKGPAETSRVLRISRFSLFEWARKQRAFEQGLCTDSPLADSGDGGTCSRDARILAEWKKHPGLGPSQIRNQLRRGGFKVSVRTVHMVMEQHGYVTPKVKRTEAHDQCYEAIRPNQLWHFDFMQRHIHKQKVSVLFLVDDFSRYIPGYALWDEDRAEAVLETFEAAVARHGKPETVMSDGGAAFWAWRGVSRFTRVLEEMGIDQLVAKVPQHNGKLEVLNANAQKELFNQERFFDLGEASARLRAWVSFYNLRRTHHALGGLLVPADRYFGRSDEVLAQIEAGAVPDGIGEPIGVADRTLDVMRVTSRTGKLELWMMGQRVWPQTSTP
jgi:transposase InsO family protein